MDVRVLGVLVAGLLVLPANVALAACEFNAQDVVYPGLYSAEWEAGDDLTAFGDAAGMPVTFGGTFHHLFEGEENTVFILDQIWQAGATPVANIEVHVSAADIASGAHDDEIRDWALGVQRWLDADPRHSLIMAPMQEMNGDWVVWGMDPYNYPAAYRRFVEIFAELGMGETQLRWMFAPNAISVFPFAASSYYPGDDVVDIVGLSAYNFGREFGEWSTVDDVLFAVTQALRAFGRDKPFLITQIGSSLEGGDREAWLSEMFDFVASHPNYFGFVYFNFDKETNWRVWDGVSVAQGWTDALDDERVLYEFPFESWFRPGPIPFSRDLSTAYPRPTSFCWTGSVTDPPQFSDVPADQFYTAPINWLSGAGIVGGYEGRNLPTGPTGNPGRSVDDAVEAVVRAA